MMRRREPTRPSITRLLAMACAICVLVMVGWSPQDDTPVAAPSAAGDGTQSAAGQVVTLVPGYRAARRVAVLPVHGEIDQMTLYSLERRIERATREGFDAIVLDIDTPGGALDATLDICHLLKTDAPANTVAWINPNAYSAGAIIALATREIVVNQNASFGDSAPITPFGNLGQVEREKIETVIRTEVVDSARRNHFDEQLVQAFVTAAFELWLVQHQQTGERMIVSREEYRTLFGQDPPEQRQRPSGSTPPPAGPMRPLVDRFLPDQPLSPSLSSDEVERQIEFNQSRPSARPAIDESMRGEYQLVRQVVAEGELLTLKYDQMIYYELAVQIIRNDEELRQFFGAVEVVRMETTWSESLVRFLISWPVRVLLIIIFLLGMFLELAMPGTGLFGVASMAALLIFIGAPMLAGLAGWMEVILILMGIVLILIELFLIPGVGIAGITGIVLLLVGMIISFVSGDLSSSEGQTQLLAGIAATFIAILGAGFGIWLLSRQLQDTKLLQALMLRATAEGDPALHKAARAIAMGDAATVGLAEGDEGLAETDLHPAGRARFGDRIHEVSSLSGFVSRGVRVRIVNLTRFNIEVEEVQE